MGLFIATTAHALRYTFPAEFDLHSFDDRGFTKRTNVRDNLGRHGGLEMSDKSIGIRTIKIVGEYHGSSEVEAESFLDDIAKALHNGGDAFILVRGESFLSYPFVYVSQCKKLKIQRFSAGLTWKSVKVTIELLCTNPFKHEPGSSTIYGITTSPQDIVIENSGNIDIPVKISRSPNASCEAFTIENVTDSGNLFRYADPLLGNGDIAVVNSVDGTVTRNSISTIRYMSGAFLRLLAGNNTIKYTGPTGGTIKIETIPRNL